MFSFIRSMAPLLSILLFGTSILFLGCNKENGAGCFTPAGDLTSQQRPTQGIRNIELYDNVNLILTQVDSDEPITVETGENLIDGIQTDIDGKKLVIKNNNYCNWTRDFDNPINVYVPVTKLDSIYYRSSGDISCTNTLVNDTLHVDIWEGSGSIEFKLDNIKSRFYIHEGTIDLNLSGESVICILSSRGFGPVNALGLECRAIFMNTRSPNDCYVKALNTLEVEITNIGNVYYMGNPPNINATVNGGGQLIMLE
jgi:hypothetical protein